MAFGFFVRLRDPRRRQQLSIEHSPKRERPERVYVDPLDAARMLGVSRSHLYTHFLNTGRLAFFKSGRRTHIAVDDIRNLRQVDQ